MKYFVYADIHGFYDEWIKPLDEKGFDINNSNPKIIICRYQCKIYESKKQ